MPLAFGSNDRLTHATHAPTNVATAFYPVMAPSAQDPLQTLLAKATYYAQTAVEAAGGPSMPGFYPNMSPSAQDPVQVLAAKLAYWLSELAGGGGGAGIDYNLEYATIGLLPAEPDDVTKVWTVGFLDGTPNMRWSVLAQAWV